jgi:DNA-directed RNA polymerase subunit RPC12/RpoP
MADAVLIFPPAYYPWFVAPGLSYLTSYLRSRGHDVVQRDANVPAIEYLISPDMLARLNAPKELVARMSRAFDTMRNEGAYHALWPYHAAKTAVEDASEYVNAHICDTFRIFRNTFQYISQYDARRRADILSAVADRENHAFYGYFSEIEVPAVRSLSPRLVGLSVNDHHQLIPAVVLASMIKEQVPDAHVCIGGNLIARLKSTLERLDDLNAQLFQHVDSFIHHEGEQPLAALLESLKETKDGGAKAVPQMIRVSKDAVESGPPSYPIELTALPLPDPEAYRPWTPKPVVALNVYRGCYYSGICSFCDINEGYDSVTHEIDAEGKQRVRFKKRLRPMDVVAADMIDLNRRYGTKVFSFTDEWFRVSEMLELGRHLKEAGAEFHWEAYARFEKAYLDPQTCAAVRQAGCRFLQFGLESIAPATLKAMRKGNTPDEYAAILGNTTAAGIWNHVFFIVGYPGEPIHHVLALFVFLRRHGASVLTIKPTRFQLARRAPLIHSVPELIEPLPEEDWDFFINIPFQYKQPLWCRRCRSEVRPHEALQKSGRHKCASCGSWLERWAPMSRKAVDAIYTLSEELCDWHWSHPATSLFPYVSRMFLSVEEMQRFAATAPPRKVVEPAALADALGKIRGALLRETEMIREIGHVYETTGLRLPKGFESFPQFLEFCEMWVEAASQPDAAREAGAAA